MARLEKNEFEEPHYMLTRDSNLCYLNINGEEYPMSPETAKAMGEAMFKTGADLLQIKQVKET